MTRTDLERRLAEHLEPESTLPRASFDALSPARLWRASNDALRRAQEARNTCALWTPEMFTRDGNAMLVLVRAAKSKGFFVHVQNVAVVNADGSAERTWARVWDEESEETSAWTSRDVNDWPLAVAIAIARAVGILGAEEEVTDG